MIMVPIAVSMLHFIGEKVIKSSKIAIPILLAIVWGSGIGGFGSPLGGSANLVAISYLENICGHEFMYIDWVSRFLPFLILTMLLNLVILLSIKLPVTKLANTKSYFNDMYKQLGPMSKGEKIGLGLFIISTVLAFARPLFADILPALRPAYIFFICGLLTFMFRDEEGKVIPSLIRTRTANWRNLWPGIGKYCYLDVPVMPNEYGKYTLEVYFNGQTVLTKNFSIISDIG
jgi:sodium-dependent dicarboxylate transporter 2/3/5